MVGPGDFVVCLGAGSITSWQACPAGGAAGCRAIYGRGHEGTDGQPAFTHRSAAQGAGRLSDAPAGVTCRPASAVLPKSLGAVQAGRPAAFDLQEFMAGLPAGVLVTVLGVGSNLLVRDGGIPAWSFAWRALPRFALTACRVHAGAAALDLNVALAARDAGIAGLEFFPAFRAPSAVRCG